jgi:chitin disaccharide deacetylase
MNNGTPPRRLIVNADDFGLSSGVNRGIIRAVEEGIVTSASLMVRWPAAAAAAAYARAHPELSVGLHVDLGEWTYADETWRPAYQVVPAEDATAVAEEVTRQLETFHRLMDGPPTHLDSHQHVHRADPAHSILVRAARTLGIALRGVDAEVRYCGAFYGQSDKGYPYPEGIAVDGLLQVLHHLSPGLSELGCHPGEGADLESTYRLERDVECQTLCDPRIRTALSTEQIVLCSFLDRQGQGRERMAR